jgi:F-type H+-transporting ATPase subunit delta
MDSILAKRYARALLELGEADGKYQAYGDELWGFAEALREAGPEGRLLFSPVIPIDARKGILGKVLDQCDLSPLVKNFILLLNERGRLPIIRDAAKAYQGLVDEHEGIVRGTVQTAIELDASQLSGIRSALSMYIGKKVELEQRVDPGIIGGLVARLGDLEVDGSVRTQLDRLAAAFQAD